MKLYSEMLNIDRAKDRKELMRSELKKKNIEAHFHKAVDYTDTKKEDNRMNRNCYFGACDM